MANMIIVAPLPIAAIAASRGSGAANLSTADPKEVWTDSEAGSAVTIDLDLGAIRSIDTVYLGHVHDAAAGAVWTITGGAGGYADTVLKAAGALRVPEAAGRFASRSHGLWFGAAAAVRYIRITLTQPGGSPPLAAGVLLIGRAFQPGLNREWGSGRRPIDTGTATPLPGGGFGVAEGARKSAFAWTFGDLTADEVEALEATAEDRGETRPVLVVEDPDATAGLWSRIHYGLFQRFRAFERRNRAQTRWELEIEQWV